MRRIPARFPEERPRGPWSIKTRLKEMTEAGSGSDRWFYSVAASALLDASTSFGSTFGSWSVQALLQARIARSTQK